MSKENTFDRREFIGADDPRLVAQHHRWQIRRCRPARAARLRHARALPTATAETCSRDRKRPLISTPLPGSNGNRWARPMTACSPWASLRAAPATRRLRLLQHFGKRARDNRRNQSHVSCAPLTASRLASGLPYVGDLLKRGVQCSLSVDTTTVGGKTSRDRDSRSRLIKIAG